MPKNIMDNYCERCRLAKEFCLCDREGPPPQHNFEVFAAMLIGQARSTIAWYTAGQRVARVPPMGLSVAQDIVRTARNVALLDWQEQLERERNAHASRV